jgi:hypothetical protein
MRRQAGSKKQAAQAGRRRKGAVFAVAFTKTRHEGEIASHHDNAECT